MTFRDGFILVFTFMVGVFSGMYFYLTAYKPIYEDHMRPPREVPSAAIGEYSVIGISYGGMRADFQHPSYRFSDNGTYNYYPGGSVSDAKVEGALPDVLLEAVVEALDESDLVELSMAVNDKDCRLYADGIEYEYNIELADTEYDLDTCRTALDHDDSLAEALEDIWRYLESPETFRFTIRNMPETDDERSSWRGLRGFLEDGFIESGFDSNF